MSEQYGGTDALSGALLELLNSFPGLGEKTVTFASIDEASGIAVFPTSGTAVKSESKDVAGNVRQICLYPFKLIYRAAPRSEIQRMRIRGLLDSIGRWLELQTVCVGSEICRLKGYPELSEVNAVIKHIGRGGPSHIGAARSDGIEDWEILLIVSVEIEFEY